MAISDFTGTTATGKALLLANEEFERQEISSNAKNVWLFTDGKSNKGTSPITEANKLRRMGNVIVLWKYLLRMELKRDFHYYLKVNGMQ